MSQTTKEKRKLEETLAQLAQKTAIAEKLVREKDEIIERELRRYDGAAFYIRLQSLCFDLYPMLIRLLARLIRNVRRKDIFRSIVKGEKLESIAERLRSTPEAVGADFRDTVHDLSLRLRETIDMAWKYDCLNERYEKLKKRLEVEEKHNRRLSGRLRCLQGRLDQLEDCLQWKRKEMDAVRQKLEDEQEWRRRFMEEKRTVAYWLRHMVFMMLNFREKLKRLCYLDR